MILPVFYDFQYIYLVLARTNMAENPKKKLATKKLFHNRTRTIGLTIHIFVKACPAKCTVLGTRYCISQYSSLRVPVLLILQGGVKSVRLFFILQ